jgi:rubrerythrin
MKHSITWWNRTKNNPAALHRWLIQQYRGEATAASRIEQLRDTHGVDDGRASHILTVIACQERKHADWVAQLLRVRGIDLPELENAAERYWQEPLKQIHDLQTGCAVGAHAEAMRLSRIEAIADDEHAPEDIRAVFQRILPEERFHERAFRMLAGEEAMDATRDAHDLGRTALGLVP